INTKRQENTETTKTTKMRLIVLSISVLVMVFLFSCGNGHESNSISASGTIESVNVTVSSKSAGTIMKLNFKEGDRVKKGDVLVEINHDLLDIQLRQAESGVELAYAQLRLLKSGARREDIKQSEDLIKQAKINLDLAKQDKERANELFKQDAMTEKLNDEANARYDLAVTQYNSARENLAKVKSIIRPEEIESADANLKKAVSAVDFLKQTIEDCKVFAPVDGFVSKKFVEEGESTVPGASLLSS